MDEYATFENFGVDSLVSLNIISRFERDLGDLPSTLLFEHLTIDQLATHLLTTHRAELTALLGVPAAPEPVPAPAAPVVSEPVSTDDVAIIGVAGRYPGSPDLDAFWRNLSAGYSGITEVPATRWDWREHFDTGRAPNTTYNRWGGFLDGIEQFDAGLFGILPRDAADIDPQERLFLETCWELLESAGYLGEASKEQATGVFAGLMYGGYGLLAAAQDWPAGRFATGHSAYWSVANRVSYVFDFTGPSFAVDSACSSSLTALHLAAESLRRGDCRMAIAGGVNLITHPAHFAALCARNMLASGDGCRVFDEAADGFVPGEGVGAVLLKPLSAAVADGDAVWAVLKGSALNAGGKTSGYTVPNPNAQAALIADALTRSGVDPAGISYVEAHGTGTALGDPIELTALSRAYGTGSPIAIGSVKSNIGHLEGAAGVAGLTKLLLQFRHRALVPTANLTALNPKIDLSESRFRPQLAAQPWESTGPRRAAMSSFGAGGANAHVVLEEYVGAPATPDAPGESQTFVLSARTDTALRALAAAVADFLPTSTAPLRDLAFTSQVGRRAQPRRAAFTVADKAELAAALVGFARTGEPTGVEPEWVAGKREDWAARWTTPARRVHFPTTVFDRRRHWITDDPHHLALAPATVTTEAGPVREFAADHPLLAVAGDHLLAGQRWVPGVALLEVARLAAGLGAPVTVSDVRWVAPVNLDTTPGPITVDLDGSAFAVNGSGTTFARGTITAGAALPQAAVEGKCPREVDVESFYSAFSRTGLEYGPALRVVRALRVGRGEAVSELESAGGHLLDPGLLDGALQTVSALCSGTTGYLPVGIGALTVGGPLDGRARVHVRETTPPGRVNGHRRFDLRLSGADGVVRQAVTGLEIAPRRTEPTETRYLRPVWTAAPAVDEAAAPPRTLLVAGDPGLRAELADRHPDAEVITITAGDRAHYREQVAALVARGRVPDTIVAAGAAFEPVLWLSTAVLERDRSAALRVLAVSTSDAPEHTAVAGTLRTLALEHSRFAGARVQVDAGAADRVVDELRALHTGAAEIRYVHGTRLRKTLERFEPPAATALTVRPDGTYLVTGGAGALGLHFAAFLTERGAGSVVLLGRSDLDAPTAAKVAALGARYHRTDLADAEQVTALVASLPADTPLRGVIHAAGVTRDARAVVKTEDQVAAVLAPKVDGTRNLDAATAGAPLDFFVLFSSVSGEAGNPGQADYAYANAFLNAYATQRTGPGRTLALGWPLWAEGGMTVDEATVTLFARVWDMVPLSTRAGFEAFIRGLASTEPSLVVVEGPVRAPATAPAAQPPAGPGVDRAEVEQALRGLAAGFLLVDESDVDVHAELLELGFDSITLTELVNRVNDRFGLELLPTVLFECPDLTTFADHLCDNHGAAVAPPTAELDLERELRLLAAGFLLVDESDVDMHAELLELGFDSITLTELVNRVNDRFGLELLPTVLFECPDLLAFADHLRTQHPTALTPAPPTPLARAPHMPHRTQGADPEASLPPVGDGTAGVDLACGQLGELSTGELSGLTAGAWSGSAGLGGGAGVGDGAGVGGNAGVRGDSGFGGNSQVSGGAGLRGTVEPSGSAGFGKAAEPLAGAVPRGATEPLGGTGLSESTGPGADAGLGEPAGPIGSAGLSEATGPGADAGLREAAGPRGSGGLGGVAEPPVSSERRKAAGPPASAGSGEAAESFAGAEVSGAAGSSGSAGTHGGGAEVGSGRTEQVGPGSVESPVGVAAGGYSAAEPVAIVGIAGVFPGSADAGGFWANLVAGADLVRTVPEDRADLRANPDSRDARGGFLDDIDAFDAKLFGISPREAAVMDPQQRLFLQQAWRAVEDAGYRPSALAGTETGVFAGVATTDYDELLKEHGVAVEAHTATGIAHSVLANRVSYLLDLRGPSETADTACSSSLVAIHRAVRSIQAGECAQAIAGGVNVILSPGLLIAFTKSGMLSPDGRCKTFDAAADGYVRGEGAGAVLLKPLRRAVDDGDHVYAVIKGSAVNHGGRSTSLTAPNPLAQARVLVRAHRDAGVDPDTVTYVEAHGTGTRLGDPIEAEGLKKAFTELYGSRGLPASGHIALGTVKTNIGHLEAAAGIAGVLKVVLAMRHGVLPASLHYSSPNPYLRLAGTPFEVLSAARVWEPVPDAGVPVLRAGISSFGFGGTNAHLVLENGPARPRCATVDGRRYLVPLSAPDEESLARYATALADHLEATPEAHLATVAHTLQTGRAPRAARLVIATSDRADLVARLRTLDGVRGTAVKNAAPATGDEPAEELARLWAAGAEVPWQQWWGHRRPNRVPLPPVPFATTRHWFTPVDRPAAPGGETTTAVPAHTAPGADVPVAEPGVAAAHKVAESPQVVGAAAEVRLPVTVPTPRTGSPDRPTSSSTDTGGRAMSSPRPRGPKLVLSTPTRSAPPAAPVVAPAPVAVAAPVAVQPASSAGAGLRESVREKLSEILGIPTDEIADDSSFTELGLDSIFRMDFARLFNAELGTELTAAELYEYDTIDELDAFVAGLGITAPAQPVQAQPAVAEPAAVVPALVAVPPVAAGPVVAAASPVAAGPVVVVPLPVAAPPVAAPPVAAAPVAPAPVVETPAVVAAPAVPVGEPVELVRRFIAEELGRDVDPAVSFTDNGFSSFDMLRVVGALEKRFGALRKTLLFDHPTVAELTAQLGDDIAAKLATVDSAFVPTMVIGGGDWTVLEKDRLDERPEFASVVAELEREHGREGGLPGRDIAPLIFLGAQRKGYFNFSRRDRVIFSWSYVGPDAYFPRLAREYTEYAAANGLQPNLLGLDRLEDADGIPFTATPFGALQRLDDLSTFTVQGSKMQRLRYVLNKFERAGRCALTEYAVGSDPAVDRQITEIIDEWADGKPMVNPYVHTVREEIGHGVLAPRHRMFLTSVADRIVSAVIVTKIPSQAGYLLDLEFYRHDMPLGGLEWTVVKIIERTVAEGATVFSFGGSFGAKVANSPNADPDLEAGLEELRSQGIFTGDGNFRFKNKFRTTNLPVYLCRPAGVPNADVADIILMIANPANRAARQSTPPVVHRTAAGGSEPSVPPGNVENGGPPGKLILGTAGGGAGAEALTEVVHRADGAGSGLSGVDGNVEIGGPQGRMILGGGGTAAGVGAVGAAGAAAAGGAVGAGGAAASVGTAGQVGDAALAGAGGRVGNAGSVGTAGRVGAGGRVGDAGSVGTAGRVGAGGSVGASGLVGTSGPVGTAGQAGSVGAVGRAGGSDSAGVAGQVGAGGSAGGAAGIAGVARVTADVALGDRDRVLADHGHNPLLVPSAAVEFDLLTDSWAELGHAAVGQRRRELEGAPGRAIAGTLPFDTIVPTASGKSAEAALCRAWPRRGVVLHNGVFPSWYFNLVDNGLEPREVPTVDLDCPFGGDLDIEALDAALERGTAFVCVEVGANSRGGAPMSLGNLRRVRDTARLHGVPLVLDATRVLENALAITRLEPGQQRPVWDVVTDVLGLADAVTLSLSKDFGVDFGGVVATSDPEVAHHLNERVASRGHEIGLHARTTLAKALADRAWSEQATARRVAQVTTLRTALEQGGAAVRGGGDAHCVLLDVSHLSATHAHPVQAFLTALYRVTGIRAGGHLAGENLVRLAVPLGLTDIGTITTRLLAFLADPTPIPDLVPATGETGPLAAYHPADRVPQDIREAMAEGHQARSENLEVLREYNPDVRRQVLALEDGDVEVFTAGSGRTLLLMLPFNIGAGLFGPQFAALAQSYRVTVVHHSGVGATTAARDLTYDGIADLTRRALAALGETGPVHVAGASFGGITAQVFALRYPEFTASLTLLCSSYKLGNRSGEVNRLSVVAREDLDNVIAKTGSERLRADRARLEELLLRSESMDPRTGLRYLDVFAAQPNLLTRLPDISVPTLIVQGRHDTVIPLKTAHLLHGSIEDSRYHEVADAGHWPNLTSPEETNRLIAGFLAERDALNGVRA
ncbi:alpha/beta fold hydrolase [Actinokineospora spheciospongiae]|uniref:alpha/beta fold hydrolase n=2 Tax=Actinokineospora spheciospongiae TaxID=909613 RepID=UPI002278FB2D|nr:alpha/beta fold hydrolase [Actinokineospora spheciospongiae]